MGVQSPDITSDILGIHTLRISGCASTHLPGIFLPLDIPLEYIIGLNLLLLNCFVQNLYSQKAYFAGL